MIANARWGANAVVPYPDGDRLIAVTTDAIPAPVVGVNNDPQALVIPQGIGRSYYSQPARPATRAVWYVLRPMHWRAKWNNGLHGVVRRVRPATHYDRQLPFLRPVRTLRSAPNAPWDVGTALGPTGRATGREE